MYEETEGPIIVWTSYPDEGFHPRSFATLAEAKIYMRSSGPDDVREFVVTRPVDPKELADEKR